MIVCVSSKFQRILEVDFIRFCVVGGTGFVINMALLILFHKIIMIPIFYSQAIAAEVALFSNFTLHHHWTYKKNKVDKKFSKLIIQFHATTWPAILGSAVMVTLAVNYLHVNSTIALIISSGVALVWNFSWSKYVVWKDVSNNIEEVIQ